MCKCGHNKPDGTNLPDTIYLKCRDSKTIQVKSIITQMPTTANPINQDRNAYLKNYMKKINYTRYRIFFI